MPDNKFRDSFDSINNAKDFSLFSTFPYLATRNLSSYDHWKTAIFLKDDALGKTPVYYSNATGNLTKVDQMYFQYGE
jgi:hypothetical protein